LRDAEHRPERQGPKIKSRGAVMTLGYARIPSAHLQPRRFTAPAERSGSVLDWFRRRFGWLLAWPWAAFRPRATSHVDHRAVSALHFGIHSSAAPSTRPSKRDDFPVLPAGRIFRRADISFIAGAPLEPQLGRVAWSARCIITPPVGPSVMM